MWLRAVALAWPLSVGAHTGGAQWEAQQLATTASFRGLSVVSERVVWASGTRGTVVRTTDGGRTWAVMAVPGADSLDFRDVEAFDARRAYVLSIGNGAASRIYKTIDGGATWALQFTNADTAAFYDCFGFWSPERGMAVSDPVGGRFRVIATSDGGGSWVELPPDRIPPAIAGEAAFAASGTCLTVRAPDNVWIVSGGGREARVYRSATGGINWQVASTPITTGAPARGIFSVAFADARRGVAVGGDYQAATDTAANVALTDDGGVTWRLAAGRPGGYRSSVAYVPGSGGRVLVAVGTSGSEYSTDGGETWTPIDTAGFNTVAFAPGPNGIGWAVGPSGRIAKWAGPAPGTESARRIRVRKDPP
ncbi:MAG: WD40/YVTN/BNR-like repeat-containing protein [Gemmatimonadaceae bacterium]